MGLSKPAGMAEEAIRLVRADRAQAELLAERALVMAQGASDPRAASMAERALGLAARERHDIRASALHLRRAVSIAERAGLAECAAEARMSLSGTLVMRGDWRGALREADKAEASLHGAGLARLRVQRASVLMDQGRLDEALEGYQQALPDLRRAGDTLWLARLFNNRGLVHCQLGNLALAQADLEKAERLHLELGQHRSVAHARQNLGLVASFRGDVVTALLRFDEADAHFLEQGHIDAASLDERCLVLLGARLLAEARSGAETAVQMLESEGRVGYLAMANLRLAECALMQGDFLVAAEAADRARRAFSRQRRTAWAALARSVGVRAAWLRGDRSAALLVDARKAATALAGAGFTGQALEAEILLAQVALSLGRRTVARNTLARARRSRACGPVQLRSRAWHAEALLRLADGNRRGARSAVRAGMRLLAEYRAALGATELRAQASGYGTELAGLGLRLAIEDGKAEAVLGWAEQWRAGALRLRPPRPPADGRLADELSELRTVAAAVDAALLAARPTARLIARQEVLEEAVRRRAWQVSGLDAGAIARPPSVDELVDALGPHALVEFVESEGHLLAVVVLGGGGRMFFRRLTPAADVASELERVLSSLRRLVYGHGSAVSLAAAEAGLAFGAEQLERMLLGPLWAMIGDRPLVVVPTGALHALPWSVLPCCTSRQVTVSPSAAVWHGAASATFADGGRTVLVAGAGLPHAAAEVAALARGYATATVLKGRAATVGDVCTALDGARLAHIAAHGRFRADNPLFSRLQLADGPLTVYDLEALERAPRTIVLSACESGLSDVRPGDELMGLTAAMFALGAQSMIASVVPVPDAATRPFMLDLHRGLRRGLAPAEALLGAQEKARKGGHASVATSAAFVCFGASANST